MGEIEGFGAGAAAGRARSEETAGFAGDASSTGGSVSQIGVALARGASATAVEAGAIVGSAGSARLGAGAWATRDGAGGG